MLGPCNVTHMHQLTRMQLRSLKKKTKKKLFYIIYANSKTLIAYEFHMIKRF